MNELQQAACALFEHFGFSRFNFDAATRLISLGHFKKMVHLGMIEDIGRNGLTFEFLTNPRRIKIERTGRKNPTEQVGDLEDKILTLATERAFMRKIKAPTDQLDKRLGLLTVEMLLKTKQLFYER